VRSAGINGDEGWGAGLRRWKRGGVRSETTPDGWGRLEGGARLREYLVRFSVSCGEERQPVTLTEVRGRGEPDGGGVV